MKPLLLVAVVVLSLISCKSDNEMQTDLEVPFTADVYPQRWEMVEMSTMFVDSQTSGDDMAYQEDYFFKRDNTFVKTRKQDGVTTEATGTFSRRTLDNGEEYYELVFDEDSEDSELIENCSVERKELLAISSEKSLNSTANMCDYPTKRYERTE